MTKKFNYHMSIQDSHIDQSKHVNNACYMTFFEMARWDIFKGSQYDNTRMHSLGIAPVLLECTIKYKKELILGEKIRIQTEIQSVEKGMFVRIKQVIFNESDKKVCIAYLRHSMLNLKTRTTTQIPHDWLEFIT